MAIRFRHIVVRRVAGYQWIEASDNISQLMIRDFHSPNGDWLFL